MSDRRSNYSRDERIRVALNCLFCFNTFCLIVKSRVYVRLVLETTDTTKRVLILFRYGSGFSLVLFETKVSYIT